MKVTKREQVLLGALLIMILCYSFYNFIYAKQVQKIAELKVSRDTLSQKWERDKVKIAAKDKRKGQYTTLKTKILKETDTLFPSIEQEKIIVVLDKMINVSKLQADVLGFSGVGNENTPVVTSKTAKIEEKSKDATNELDKLVSAFNGDAAKDDKSKKEKTNNSKVSTQTKNSMSIDAYKMQVAFKFKGMYDEFISFIEQVEDYDKKIIINNINLTGAEGSDVSGTIILDFYGIPKLDDNDYFVWDYKKPSGNGNPFLGSSSSLQVNKGVITNKEKKNQVNSEITDEVNKEVSKEVAHGNEIKSDFILNTKPKTSDLHTVTIEKAKDESKQSYIYADNAGIEKVELYFTKIGDKYFYKYKTSGETYPKDFSNSTKFVPNGKNIILDIFSQKRGLASDLSGANIKITNGTDKSIIVNILDDDKIKPRVKILKEKGDISVIRNYIRYTDK
ncbi:MAG: hypothetical protein ACREV6_02500 [Clostridium sp.]|uniref:hypothetical protein n=1 Tax=Clostridium sp. TaxID=1506 RepID=UPI003D6D03C7